MREVEIKKDKNTTVTLKSPWLDITLAAGYLMISRTEFLKFADRIPHKGFGNRKRFHVEQLDEFNPKKDKA
jgi:hypothetical protein